LYHYVIHLNGLGLIPEASEGKNVLN